MKQHYVCGFVFNEARSEVLLILKNRGPVNMAGMINGIGGKVEHAEGFRSAISREFKEETGIFIEPIKWYGFHYDRFRNDAHVHYFVSVLDEHTYRTFSSETDERIQSYKILEIVQKALETLGVKEKEKGIRVFSDLSFLLPMAFQASYQILDRQNLG